MENDHSVTNKRESKQTQKVNEKKECRLNRGSYNPNDPGSGIINEYFRFVYNDPSELPNAFYIECFTSVLSQHLLLFFLFFFLYFDFSQNNKKK